MEKSKMTEMGTNKVSALEQVKESIHWLHPQLPDEKSMKE